MGHFYSNSNINVNGHADTDTNANTNINPDKYPDHTVRIPLYPDPRTDRYAVVEHFLLGGLTVFLFDGFVSRLPDRCAGDGEGEGDRTSNRLY